MGECLSELGRWVVDHKGPVILLAISTVERFVFYSFDSNLVLLFTNELGMAKNVANTIYLLWKGVSYCFSIAGALLSDAVLGSYKTLLVGYIGFSIGIISLTIGLVPLIKSQRWISYLAVIVMSVSIGILRPNTVKFAGDQFKYQEDREEMRISFFSWLYFFASIAGLAGYIGMSYIQQHVSFPLGIGIPALFMFLVTVALKASSRNFVKLPPPNQSIKELVLQNCSCGEAQKDLEINAAAPRKGIKKVLVFLSFMLIFWCEYGQLGSILFTQSLVLNLKLFSFHIPSTISYLFNIIAIVILIPLFQKVLYPFLQQLKIDFSLLDRVAVGLLLSTLAMFYSGCIEVYRLTLVRDGRVVNQFVGGRWVEAADLSVFVQAPAFFLIGAGEVLACVTAMEYGYNNSPPSVKTLVLSFNSLMNASGHSLGSLLIIIVNSVSDPVWIGENPNESHIDLYLFLLTIIGLLNFFSFLFVSLNYLSK